METFFFFQAEDGIRDIGVTGVQTCALPISVPLGIIHKRDVTITVCYYETNMMLDFVSYQQKRGEGFTDYVDLIFRLFLSSAVWYLKRLKQINTLIEKAKHNLDQGVNNESLIGLSRLQDSLTYFITRSEERRVGKE